MFIDNFHGRAISMVRVILRFSLTIWPIESEAVRVSKLRRKESTIFLFSINSLTVCWYKDYEKLWVILGKHIRPHRNKKNDIYVCEFNESSLKD